MKRKFFENLGPLLGNRYGPPQGPAQGGVLGVPATITGTSKPSERKRLALAVLGEAGSVRDAASSNLGMRSLAHVNCLRGKADRVHAVVGNNCDPSSHFILPVPPILEASLSLDFGTNG